MTINRRILIYGAGGLGVEVLNYLISVDRKPVCFIDRRGAELDNVCGVNVYQLEDARERFSNPEDQVVIAVHNYQSPIAEILKILNQSGYSNIATLWQFCQQERWLPQEPYWLSPHFEWRSKQSEINSAYNLLDDDTSRRLFAEQIALRSHGDYVGLSTPDASGQYAPDGLPPYSQPIRMIDCGAYDGDTIRNLIARGYEFEKVIAFEPDPESFSRLDNYLQSNGLGEAINTGTYDRTGTIRFSNLGTGASHIDQRGEITIKVESLDSACKNFAPTLIKMDVEGAEAASIRGAENLISKYKPVLAISTYHKPDDLWILLLMIHQFDLNYHFYIRSHGCNGFDTVLYAVPA
ncbi:MAG: FkbM family methyltransferase [Gammaproteobacteria bacterium]|nr:FkbM family methyltransferase [Gammaproteobacteria bacterium]